MSNHFSRITRQETQQPQVNSDRFAMLLYFFYSEKLGGVVYRLPQAFQERDVIREYQLYIPTGNFTHYSHLLDLKAIGQGSVLQTMIGLEPNHPNRALLKLLYVASLRVSEVTQLHWFSLQPRDVGGQVLVYGKGGKTRAIKLPASLWQELQFLLGDAAIDEPVFTSRKKKGFLWEMQVNRIVKAAAKRVPGLEGTVAENVSPTPLATSCSCESCN